MNTDAIPNMPAEPIPPAPQPASRGGGRKIVKWVLLAIVLLIVIALVAVYINLNSIVRRTIETQASSSLNVATTLKAASVSLFGGQVGLSDLRIGSPSGFKSPEMMSLGGVDVGVKLSELRADPLRVNQISITNPKLVIEMQGMKFNIKQFINSLPAGDPKPADQSEPLKLIITTLKVHGAQVVFRPDLASLSSVPGIGQNLAGLKQEYVLSIPPLEMQNVGSAEGNQNGAAIKEVVSLLVTQLAAKATQSDQLPHELRQVLNLNVEDLTNMVKAKLGEQVNTQLSKIRGDLSKKLPGNAGKAIEQGLGGLLGGKEKNKKHPATQPK